MKIYLLLIAAILATSLTGCSGFDTGGLGNRKTDGGTTPTPEPPCGASVTLAWDNPRNTTNLAGIKIYYGLSSGAYSTIVEHASATITVKQVDNLPAGTYFFAVTAYTTEGLESDFSNEISVNLKPCESVFITSKK